MTSNYTLLDCSYHILFLFINLCSSPSFYSCFSESGATWDSEIREDVLEECMKFGNVLHVQVDKFSQGNVYVKCQTPQVANLAMASFNGRFYASMYIQY